MKIAASVWGKPDAYCRLWRSTTNGLEGLAALHNDGLLILDELSQMDPKDAGEAAYMLANGQGKNRASRHGTVKPSFRWSLFFLSAGEESLSSLMARAGQRTNAGQEIRLADIEADAGEGMGLFEHIHDQLSPATMALSLKDYASRYHGAVGLAWLRAVVENHRSLAEELPGYLQDFVEYSRIWSSSGQTARVARRFALVAAAGEIATEYGLTGWGERRSPQSSTNLFQKLVGKFWFLWKQGRTGDDVSSPWFL